jgi:hypothetical protein
LAAEFLGRTTAAMRSTPGTSISALNDVDFVCFCLSFSLSAGNHAGRAAAYSLRMQDGDDGAAVEEEAAPAPMNRAAKRAAKKDSRKTVCGCPPRTSPVLGTFFPESLCLESPSSLSSRDGDGAKELVVSERKKARCTLKERHDGMLKATGVEDEIV